MLQLFIKKIQLQFPTERQIRTLENPGAMKSDGPQKNPPRLNEALRFQYWGDIINYKSRKHIKYKQKLRQLNILNLRNKENTK